MQFEINVQTGTITVHREPRDRSLLGRRSQFGDGPPLRRFYKRLYTRLNALGFQLKLCALGTSNTLCLRTLNRYVTTPHVTIDHFHPDELYDLTSAVAADRTPEARWWHTRQVRLRIRFNLWNVQGDDACRVQTWQLAAGHREGSSPPGAFLPTVEMTADDLLADAQMQAADQRRAQLEARRQQRQNAPLRAMNQRATSTRRREWSLTQSVNLTFESPENSSAGQALVALSVLRPGQLFIYEGYVYSRYTAPQTDDLRLPCVNVKSFTVRMLGGETWVRPVRSELMVFSTCTNRYSSARVRQVSELANVALEDARIAALQHERDRVLACVQRAVERMGRFHIGDASTRTAQAWYQELIQTYPDVARFIDIACRHSEAHRYVNPQGITAGEFVRLQYPPQATITSAGLTDWVADPSGQRQALFPPDPPPELADEGLPSDGNPGHLRIEYTSADVTTFYAPRVLLVTGTGSVTVEPPRQPRASTPGGMLTTFGLHWCNGLERIPGVVALQFLDYAVRIAHRYEADRGPFNRGVFDAFDATCRAVFNLPAQLPVVAEALREQRLLSYRPLRHIDLGDEPDRLLETPGGTDGNQV